MLLSQKGRAYSSAGKNKEEEIYANVKCSPGSQKQNKQRPENSKNKESTVRSPRCLMAVTFGILCLVLLLISVVLTTKFLQDSQKIKEQHGIGNMSQEKINYTSEIENLREEIENTGNLSKLYCEKWFVDIEKIYCFHLSYYSWNESRKFCEDKGFSLLKINHRDELDFMKKNVYHTHWIGLSYARVLRCWTWEDGSPLSPDLNLQEPSLTSPINCGVLETSKLGARDCSMKFPFVCEQKHNRIRRKEDGN
ncbi:C-type lectin domain family 7 member A-like [Tachyglossus aculeatus]|uniref:C-type lectin domain family 7 member A-like n=1 Tax=Tachyglossus aculeatus TaxID=9261 RepID=UPI0018F3AAFD|nr:C-type lectin domain family 7 member A-like [Tachyglossus aculeatus]